MIIKIACAGFPVGKKTYQTNLPTVELTQLFDRMPLAKTLIRWRKEAPKHFEFIVCASKVITHSGTLHKANSSKRPLFATRAFQDSAAVRHALGQTLAAAETLRSRLILFQLPPHFSAHSDNVQRIQQFFGRTSKGHTLFAWEPPASWPASLVDALSDSLRLMPVTNPFRRKKPSSNDVPLRYYRLGAGINTSGVKRFSDDELRQVKAACDAPLCYVTFNNGPTAYEDAIRFASMLDAAQLP